MASPDPTTRPPTRVDPDDEGDEPFVLSDLLNHVLDKGVVLRGHVTISVADIDLLVVDLRLLLSSVETATRRTGFDADALHGLR